MRENITKAREIEQSVNRKYIELREEAHREIGKATSNTDLSPEGRQKQAQRLRQKYAGEVINLAKELKSDYQAEVTKAKVAAQKELEKETKKPDEVKVKKFESNFNDLKTKIMLSNNSQESNKQLLEFVKSIEGEPYLANRLKDDFASVISPILSNAGDQRSVFELRKSLEGTFNHLNTVSLTEEQREAKEVYDLSGSLYDAKLFSPVAMDNARDIFGRELPRYLNDPDSYPQDIEIDVQTGRMEV
ncbi:hypothetical protein [Virgibacillus necropolis]|uniref:Uncharacterized protein n=1 Tax=Virgibacillus necropolis TaxID=163877 RepID=A0A221MCK5_9BACI|nr:hypothetical protein [Virgibacillus necropolis]ASN05309.1 hypothetical protein CFK40_09935 [Virgibacillus necropolis]